ncbi:disease resistance protein RUN1-like isoform X1 [Humulus lupulus]|uniref:disease resistance protein RUN1-like isoform X1 n=1 Tax=Humulus lupulus TaxID=3486 RepID=UPI002B40AD9A|nr:disease resistance protein RUN1-like isoform X1 [Humulus lupulus]XP_062082754.1 disease resistance protein RUN1-like isoform X1 [Humulus lupulus]XP_062082755.1 disease resistance protein RUN1-like isoform X1 [Humulus lupulus]
MAPKNKYNVFISFRGEDTRYNFTSHLHKALSQKSLQVYMDQRLERGDEICFSLLKAIEDSMLSVIIFSENYASSRWCLDELVHILRCKERDGQIVVPIFYHVSPCDVRKQSGSFGVAFGELKERFKRNSDTQWMNVLISILGIMTDCFRSEPDRLTQWRNALISAANLSGWDAPTRRCDESELIGKIVNDILKKLNHVTSSTNVLNGLVGMERRIEYLESLFLTNKSSLDAQIVGIWGMGGMGKTTLAHVLFTRIYNKFEGHCFLENIREEWQNPNRLNLKKKLYAELLKEDNNQDMVVDLFVKDRLCRKKVLVVLDDLDDVEQFEYLVGGRDWLSHGSRVIVTTRDKQLLKNIGIDWIYMAEQLDDDEALQLFSLNAFKRDSPPKKYMELSKKVMIYAAGMPLALKVLGSHLYSKSEEEWNSALKKLKKFPNKKIQNILKISYDGLDDKQQDIFLDVACFFKGKEKDFVGRILDDDGMFADVIRDLIDRCLIVVTSFERLWMHDLIQEMGREIVREECVKDPGMCSRLWITKDICHMLRKNKGSEKIEGVFLNMSEIRESHIKLEPNVFKEMSNLRLLQICGISREMEQCKLQLPQGLDTLPDSLRYLHWLHYPLNSLPSTFVPQYLVELDMPSSKLEQLPNEFELLENLKVVNLSSSKNLIQIPDISRANNLKSLCLKDCESLVEVPSLRFQQALDHKCFTKETKAAQILYTSYGNIEGNYVRPGENNHKPSWWKSYKAIDYFLNLSGCSNLKVLSEVSGSIKYICLHSTAIEDLHSSIWSLVNLSLLDLSNCKCLKNLPSGIGQLESLNHLYLDGCSSFKSFPEHLPKNIRTLDFSGTKIKQVPSSAFENLSSLEDLCLKNCIELETLPTSICKLSSLVSLNLSDCSKFKSFPEILEPMGSLKKLYLDRTGITKLHLSIENITGLHWLILRECKNLEFIPNNIYNMSHLKVLCLSSCSKLVALPAVTKEFQFKIEVDLSYNNIAKVPSWNLGLSSLPLMEFEPCGSMIDRRPVSIERLSNMVLYLLETCDNNQTFTSPDFDVTSCRCFISSSRKIPYQYCGCSRWNVVKYKNLVTDFWVSLFIQAAYFGLKPKKNFCPRMNLCCPGNELPEIFLDQSEGSSIDVYLFPSSYNSNFIGFAFCVVIEFQHYCFDINRLNFQCEYHFKTNNGESNKRNWSLHLPDNTSRFVEIGILNSDHMFMGFINEEYDEYFGANPIIFQVSFKFHLEQHDWEELVNVGKCKVKKCGIQVLNLEHLIDLLNHKDAEATTSGSESETMDFGTEYNINFDNYNHDVTYYKTKQFTVYGNDTFYIPLSEFL